MRNGNTTTDGPAVGHVLRQHHGEIEEACLALIRAGIHSATVDLTRSWGDIELQLIDHMMAEEHFLLPSYQRDEPGRTQDLRDQHTWLRERAREIAIAIQLHSIRIEQLYEFAAELRAHAAYEERSLYRWADRAVPAEERRRLNDWLAAAS